MHKLKLPLLFSVGLSKEAYKYTVSKGSEDNKVDLTSVSDGSIYKNHCEEALALEFFKNGTWVVVGTAKVDPALGEEVTRATYAVADAKQRLADAELAVEVASKPYLA